MTDQHTAGAEATGEPQSIAGHPKAGAKPAAEKAAEAAPAPAPKAAAARRPASNRLYSVTDTSATAGNRKRTHDIMIDGEIKSVDFVYNAPTQMPFAEAMKFQKEGFIVKDDAGNVVNRPTEVTLESVAQFGPDKVVAYLSELTREALYARAAILPGGEDFTSATVKETLVSFLTESSRKKISDNTRSQGGIEELAEDELEGMGIQSEAA